VNQFTTQQTKLQNEQEVSEKTLLLWFQRLWLNCWVQLQQQKYLLVQRHWHW